MAVARELSSQKPGESESWRSVSTLYVRFSTSKKPPQNQNAVPHNLDLFLCHSCKCKGKRGCTQQQDNLQHPCVAHLYDVAGSSWNVNGESSIVSNKKNTHDWGLTTHEKTTNLISRILFLHHHLSGRNITATILLPTLDPSRLWRDRASSPQTILYMALQHPRFTPSLCYQKEPWALTSHFHLFPGLNRSSYFLWHCLFLSRFWRNGSRRLTGGLLCAVRTFLIQHMAGSDGSGL